MPYSAFCGGGPYGQPVFQGKRLVYLDLGRWPPPGELARNRAFRGRFFGDQDTKDTTPVVIINETNGAPLLAQRRSHRQRDQRI